MELFQLRSFLQVAESGSFTRAAEALFVTQPAVTQHVRALEQELGVRLFDRTGRGVRLTAAGTALQYHARRSLTNLEEGRQVIADLQSGAAGRLVIGAGVTTSIFHLPGWLRRFREMFPGIDVVVRTGRSREVASMILERIVDVGLVTSLSQHAEIHAVPLFEEQIVLVIAAGETLLEGRNDGETDPNALSLPVEHLASVPLILFPPGTGFREYLDRSLAEARVSPTVKMESDSLEAIKSFVAVGLGASFLPAAAVAAEIDSGVLRPVAVSGLPSLKRQTSALYRSDRYLTAGARGFLGVLAG
ncbi:MAG: LysR family transcriptional regulator [Chloroflexi bacterium]|nr:LysR family transcriptional regulator [Chloroflexota bacterium]